MKFANEFGDSPANLVSSLSCGHVAYVLVSERVRTAIGLWLNRCEAGAAAYGMTVLAGAGCQNRTSVLLFLNRYLIRWPSGEGQMEDVLSIDLEAL
jgi:hypothetical protein